MTVTSRSQLGDTEDERRNAFIKSLSDSSTTRNQDGQLGIYSRLLGLRLKRGQVFNLATLLENGLPLSAGEQLAEHLGMESRDFFRLCVGMSDTTIRRRVKAQHPLSTNESDRVLRYAHLLDLATKLMSGSEQFAREWLSSPVHALGGATPLETAVTEAGARRVEDLVVAFESGNFS